MIRASLLVALLIASTPALAEGLPAGDADAGANVFKRCAACHAVGEGAPNKVGPELNGLFGRTAGSVPNYNYSDANKASGIVWTEESFADYIRNPRGVIKGTKMAFAGLKKDEDIANLIAYLARFDADGKAKQ